MSDLFKPQEILEENIESLKYGSKIDISEKELEEGGKYLAVLHNLSYQDFDKIIEAGYKPRFIQSLTIKNDAEEYISTIDFLYKEKDWAHIGNWMIVSESGLKPKNFRKNSLGKVARELSKIITKEPKKNIKIRKSAIGYEYSIYHKIPKKSHYTSHNYNKSFLNPLEAYHNICKVKKDSKYTIHNPLVGFSGKYILSRLPVEEKILDILYTKK